MALQTLRSPKVTVNVRWIVQCDLPAVLIAEDACFGFFGWHEQDFREALRQRHCIGIVATLNERVVGHMVYELHKTHLLLRRFVVHPNFRRQWVGRQMLNKLIGKLSTHRRSRLVCNVPETAMDMQLFLRAMGVQAVRVEPGFYEDGEDAYRFVYRCC